jgi:beta-1,2-mannobiose phosphorylase / 1,2-beta-oligomannan phosphorylase
MARHLARLGCTALLLFLVRGATAQSDNVLRFPLNENTGTTVHDFSPYGNNGVCQGATWTAGYTGNALYFDGGTDAIVVPNSTSLGLRDTMTIVAWIKGYYMQGSNSINAIAWKYSAYRFGLYGGRLYSEINANGTKWTRGTTYLLNDTWYMVAMSYDTAIDGYPTTLADADGEIRVDASPIIPVGPPGAWDRQFREIGNILFDPNDPDPNFRYKMLLPAYSGSYVQNNVFLDYAYSPDGATWTKYGQALKSRSLEDPYVVLVDGVYHLVAEDKGDTPFRDIRHYHSTDFINWVDDGVALDIQGGGNPNNWELQDVSSPVLWVENGTWYMFYEGRGPANGGLIGLATSTDGFTWTRDPNSPIYRPPADAWDGTATVPDDIVKLGDTYYMTYHGYGSKNLTGFWSGVLVSTDLHTWTPTGNGPFSNSDTVMLLPQGDSVVTYHHIDNWGVYRFTPYRISAPHLYLNGVEEHYYPRMDCGNVPIALSDYDLGIGENLGPGPNNDFQGTIDDVRIYNRALSAAELLAMAQTPPDPPSPIGDVNCDGHVDFGDINPFVLALTDPPAFAATYPDCPMANRDINADGTCDFGDINPFVALLTQH